MRVRTEAKRDSIVETAAQLFKAMGYERTSMATISTHVGGSKATLYGYFPSKESLFIAVVEKSAERGIGPAIATLEDRTIELNARLQRFGEGFLAFLSDPDTIAGRRMVIAEAGRSELGRTLYEAGPQKTEMRVAIAISADIKAGRLRKVDAHRATLQLFALLEAETMLPRLLGVAKPLSKRGIADAVSRAVATFLAAYASAS